MSDTDLDLIDRAVRLAQGDFIDGFTRSPLAVVNELGVFGEPEESIGLEAYLGVWEELGPIFDTKRQVGT